MMNESIPHGSDFLLYTASDGEVRIEVLLNEETIWLTQKQLAELFDVEVNTINYHIKEIFKAEELEEKSVIRKIRITAADGKNYDTAFYNLDMIISVGYRVNSEKATRFRIWATQRLREYIIKGFVLDDKRLAGNGKSPYFSELLDRIRAIRASERMFYQKITDIYATSLDYDKQAEITQTFYKTVQNKLHWAITGQTAAELIAERSDSSKPNMGLMSWKNSPKGMIQKTDVTIAKNYLQEPELKELNRVVNMYLDFAENRAERGIAMKMQDWVGRLDAFLGFNEYEILDNPGKVSHEIAKTLAEKEFDEFRLTQDREFISDFDEVSKKYLERGANTGEDKK